MKVLHLVHAFQTGGAEHVVLNLVRHGGKTVENFVCSLTGPNDLASELQGRGAGFHCLHKRPGNDPSLLTALSRLIGERQFDVVHSQNWGTYLEGLIAAKMLAKRRPAFIFAFHGKSLDEVSRGVPFRRRAAQRLANWMTDACVAPAVHMADEYARNIGIRRERIRVIYNGIDTTRFRPSESGARAGLGLKNDDFVVGFVGRLDPVKDVRGLVSSFCVFRNSLPSSSKRACLLIIGDGEEREQALRVATEHGLGEAVVLTGARSDVARCMSAMDVYFQPSHYEGHSLTLLEAMASGLPVVSTAVGGTPEVVTEGRTGFLLRPGDYTAMARRLLELHADPVLRRSFGAAAREDVVRRFSVEAMVGNYERLYRELLRIPEQRCVA
jgi:sugar transferase (PEP-CTERM/EpsH1 system associated)